MGQCGADDPDRAFANCDSGNAGRVLLVVDLIRCSGWLLTSAWRARSRRLASLLGSSLGLAQRMVNLCDYRGQPLTITQRLLDEACRTYFLYQPLYGTEAAA